MKLSIIIPVFNEERTIKQVIDALQGLSLSGVEKEILVVDDGSTDKTHRIVMKLRQAYPKMKVITKKVNSGKGNAVRSGIYQATGDYVIIQDADLEYRPEDIRRLLLPVLSGEAQVVYGTRLKRWPDFRKDERTAQFFIHYVGNKFLSFLTSILYGSWITDMETGYKLMPRDVASSLALTSDGFAIEAEITAKILKKGYRIIEIPISTNPRGYDQGKKLHTVKDGFEALKTLLVYRFGS